MQSEWEMEVIIEYIDNYLKKFEQGGKKRDRVVGCVKCREGFFFLYKMTAGFSDNNELGYLDQLLC